jgi:hypothetical protein
MKRSGIICLWILLAGCAATYEVVSADEVLQRFVGRPIGEVRASWGEPQQIGAADGSEVYTWVVTRYGSDYFPANVEQGADASRAQRLDDLLCRARFTVVDGTVTSAAWIGSECYEP